MIGVVNFLEHLKTTKPPSYRLYSSAFKSFCEFSGLELENLNPFTIKPAEVHRFILGIRNPFTANSVIAAFRSYARFVEENYITHNVSEFFTIQQFCKAMKSLKYEEVPEFPKREAITFDQLVHLLNLIEERGKEDEYVGTVVHFYFGARPAELLNVQLGRIDFSDVESLAYERRCVADIGKCVIFIPTAKSRRRGRILPFDERMRGFIKLWANYYSDTYPNWLTMHLVKYKKELGFNICSRTARKTFETLMTPVAKQWAIDYWLGHKRRMPDIYRDYTLLLKDLKSEIVEQHYMNPLLEDLV